MGDIAIKVEGLSKQYRIGGAQASYQTLRESLVSAASAPLLWLRGERQEQNTIWALDDVSFEVKRGEAVGIIGRNGAGKSTLLKILSRITRPTRGRVDLYGRVGSLLEVGTGFHPELSGRENIYLNGAILGMTRREIHRKFDEIVDFAEIEKFLDTPVKHYSSGMYVRLAFAVAAHLEPEILVVDEVLAVGDAQFQKKCLGKMGDVAREGRTVLFVSHNMTAIKALCQNSILLAEGQISDQGNTNEVVDNYLNLSSHQATERIWEDPQNAPGNDMIRFKSARVNYHSSTGMIDVNTPVDLEFEIWNFLDSGKINFSLVLYTNDNICVLNTASKKISCTHGVIKGICHIPGDFLNDAVYRVRILIVKDGRGIFDEEDMVSFEVFEGERNGDWHGKWIGVVRPKFEWDIEK
jgi:lipopolysaccharide transport system ATP-binding protein